MSHFETEKRFTSAEAERNKEVKEQKEGEKDPELLAAASMERADLIVKEVKNNKKQMQNIVMHITEVKKLIKQIRAQLQLVSDDTATSTEQDELQLQKLKKQIKAYQEELVNMREDLINGYFLEISQTHPNLTNEEQHALATKQVDQIIQAAHE